MIAGGSTTAKKEICNHSWRNAQARNEDFDERHSEAWHCQQRCKIGLLKSRQDAVRLCLFRCPFS